MPRLKAIVFDLDDTLYPEEAYVASGFRAVSTWAQDRLGFPADRSVAELRELFDAGVRGNTFDRWLENHGLDPASWVPQMVNVYREHRPRIRPYPEVVPKLRLLRQRYLLGLVSDGDSQVQQRKLDSLGISHYFRSAVLSDTLGREAWKPSPRPFQHVLETLGVTGPESVYVADNPLKDFVGAKQVGMWAVRVRRPGGIYARLEPPSPQHEPHAEIATLEELDQAIDCLSNR